MKLQRPFQLFILLSMVFMPFGGHGHVFASAKAELEPSVTTTINPSIVTIGETAVVSVDLNNIPAQGYSGAEFTCYTDSLEADNILPTGLFGANPITVINEPGDGTFIFVIAGNQGQKALSTGTVFTFGVKSTHTALAWVECTARVSTADNMLSDLPSEGAAVLITESVPTPSPLTPTIAPTVCDQAQFIENVTIPPGTVLAPGETFLKTWRFMNLGSCDWDNYELVFVSGELMNEYSVFTIPLTLYVGEILDLSLELVAPLQPGSYHGYWMFRNREGELFGIGPQGNQPFSVDINVASPTSTQASPTYTPTPTIQPGYSPTPLVATPVTPSTGGPIPGVFFDFFANACSASWFSGAGQLHCPGSEGDIRGFMRKLDHPALETGGSDTRPGILMVPEEITNGHILGIYPPLKVRNGDRFRATIGCEGGVANCYMIFRLDYAPAGSNTIQTFWAFVEKSDGNQFAADIDLSMLAGQDISFILTVLAIGSPIGDRAMWIDPIIYRSQAESTPIPSATVTSTAMPTSTPTITQTSVPTESSGMISIRGKVLAAKPVTVTLYNTEHVPVTSVIAQANGDFSFSVPPGTYSVGASAPGSLGVLTGFTQITSSELLLPTITLPAGDIDGSNIIDQFDVLTIGMNYNASSPDVADLNNDAVINLLDLQVLALNYQKIGPISWQ